MIMVAILVIVVIGTTYYIYFSGKVDSKTLKIVYIFLTASVIYSIYGLARTIFRNRPVLTFRKNEIEISEKGKPVFFLWPQITGWEIEKDKSAHYLVIEADGTKLKVNISWLDKNPDEIKELLADYKMMK